MSPSGPISLPTEVPEAPVWLHEEPELVVLLQAALDRFDRQPAGQRARDVFLPAEQFLPTLARSDAVADQLWRFVAELAQLGVLGIRAGRRGAYDPAWKAARLAFPLAAEQTLRKWFAREREIPALAQWRVAVAARAAIFPNGCDALMERRIGIEGRSAEEVVAAFARMASMNGPITLRQLSARCFWGDSKVLDMRGDLIARLFPALAIRDRAIVVSVFLPPECDGVLFIENQDTYTAACNGFPAAAATLALVYASGFRSSADRIRAPGGALLHFAGPGAQGAAEVTRRFEAWWFETGLPLGQCSFWGDLDFAGMQILKTLRARFGDVTAWQPGYAPMLAALRVEGGHSVQVADGSRQVDPLATGCVYADVLLLPAVREHGLFDQEHVHAPCR